MTRATRFVELARSASSRAPRRKTYPEERQFYYLLSLAVAARLSDQREESPDLPPRQLPGQELFLSAADVQDEPRT